MAKETYNVTVWKADVHVFPYKWKVWRDGTYEPEWYRTEVPTSDYGIASTLWGAKWAAKRSAKRLAKYQRGENRYQVRA
jgi:hypothetical protein